MSGFVGLMIDVMGMLMIGMFSAILPLIVLSVAIQFLITLFSRPD